MAQLAGAITRQTERLADWSSSDGENDNKQIISQLGKARLASVALLK